MKLYKIKKSTTIKKKKITQLIYFICVDSMNVRLLKCGTTKVKIVKYQCLYKKNLKHSSINYYED